MQGSLIALVEKALAANRALTKEERLARPRGRAERRLAVGFRGQGVAFLSEFRHLRRHFAEALREDEWSPLFDAALLSTLSLLEDPIDELSAAALDVGAKEAIADLGIDLSFSLENPRAVDWLKAHGAERVRGINDTTRGYLRTVITEGVQKGWSYDQVAKAITDRYKEFAVGRPQAHIDSRAHLIAVTEAGDAYEQGNYIVGEDLTAGGLELEQSWLTVGDDHVDEGICAENERQGWIPFGKAFQSGDRRPLGHPACRCTLLLRVMRR